MTRLNLDMSIAEMILAMAENNPGALSVLMRGTKEIAKIDPDSAFGPFSLVLPLDDLEIYGSRIWMLYKDVCKENLVLMAAALRANQLGFTSTDTLNHAIDNYGEGVDPTHLHALVCGELPNFRKETEQ